MVLKFKRKIRRAGGSKSVAIPPVILEALNLKLGDQVNIYMDNDHIIIEKGEG